MSDRPSTPMDDEPENTGGWHAPKTPGVWRTPEQKPEPTGWRVPALPKDIEATPRSQGEWHRPRPEDTIFTEDDEIEVGSTGTKTAEDVSELSPEDMIMALIRQAGKSAPAADAGEDEDEEDIEDPVEKRALELLQDDEEAFSVSELVALASLVEDMGDQPLAPGIGEDADLSPAERALYQTAAGAAEEVEGAALEVPAEGEDAAAYARRMAAQLAGTSAGEALTTPDAGESAADYARRMAAQLAAGGEGDFTPLPEQTSGMPVMDPETAELASRFRETQQQVQQLKRMYQTGQITRDDLQNQLRQYMVLDNNNVWWMMGVETDAWYRFDNGEWVTATPPVPLGEPAPRSPLTETGQLLPDDVLAGSLPYLPDTGARSPTEHSTAGDSLQVDSSFMPLPRRAPIQDLGATMVTPAAFETTLPGQEATVAGMGAVGQQTIPSPAVRSVYDADDAFGDEPPDYDLGYSPTYDQFAEVERASLTRRLLTLGGVLVAIAAVIMIGFFIFVMVWYNNTIAPFQDRIAALASYEPAFQTARILDAEGGLIAELTSGTGGARVTVPLEQISPFMVHAIISQEDQRYYDNPGWDVAAIIRAFFQNLSAGQVESGGSTITQQIARNLVLGDTQITAERKINEILVAMEIARQYDKNFILELYLNEIFFGNQSYGVEAASQFYFRKPASELNMAEAALLASIVPAPAENDPVVNRDRALRNLRTTIRLMLQVGCLRFQHGAQDLFCITPDTRVTYEGESVRLLTVDAGGNVSGGLLALQIAQVELGDYRPREFNVKYPHFVNWIQAQIELLFGPDAMFQRGFTIHTTLIPRIQNTAEAALAQQVAGLVDTGVNTGAVMVADVGTGAIRAMVGSPDFANEEIAGQVDNTRTWQQPGSAIKPILYAAALRGSGGRYMTPATILWDVPSDYGGYAPVNFNRRFNGPIPMRFALQNSYNVSAVDAYNRYVGNDLFVDIARAMGIQFLPETQFGLPSALGANDVRLIDMMRAYSTIANGGVAAPLYAIERITETIDGRAVEVPMEARPAGVQAISPQVAYLLQNILSDDQARANEFGLRSNMTLERLGIPTLNRVAAKTGTTNNNRDLWAMGFTSNTVVGVWLGTFDNAPTFNTSGFLSAAPLWNRVMEAAIDGRPVNEFRNPGGVVVVNVCRDTGALADDSCVNRTTELAIQNQLPPPADQGFVQTLQIDSWTGMRANEWCQENILVQTFASIDNSFAVNWINSTTQGQQYAQRLGLPLPMAAPPQAACQQGMSLPTIRLNNPTDNQTLTGTVTITGQVFASDLSRYQLEYAPISSPENFQIIGSFSTEQHQTGGSTLGTWDTTVVPNGTYILRLAAFSNSGGFIYRPVQVNVANVAPTATPPPLPTQPPQELFTPIPFDEFTPIPFEDPTPTATIAP